MAALALLAEIASAPAPAGMVATVEMEERALRAEERVARVEMADQILGLAALAGTQVEAGLAGTAAVFNNTSTAASSRWPWVTEEPGAREAPEETPPELSKVGMAATAEVEAKVCLAELEEPSERKVRALQTEMTEWLATRDCS